MAPAHDRIPLAALPAETLRLLADRRRALLDRGWPAPSGPDPLLAAARAGTLDGFLWIGPKDEPIGLVLWQKRSRTGRCAELHLTAEYAQLAPVTALLRAAESVPGPPIVRLALPAVAIAAEALAPRLEPEGWRWFERMEMRYPADRPIPVVDAPEGLRPLAPGDGERLTQLMGAAYADWPLDAAYFGLGEEVADEPARAVAALLDGTFGRPWWGAGFGVERAGRLVAATMVNDYHGPLIAEVMVEPAERRRGMARALLLRTVRALREAGAVAPRLAVTGVNDRARALYTGLGFERTPFPPDNEWVAFDRVGRPELGALLPTLLRAEPGPRPIP